MLPGSNFGRPETELTVRMAFVCFDGEEALTWADRRAKEYDFHKTYTRNQSEAASSGDGRGEVLGEDFLHEVCPDIIDGESALAEWLFRS